MSTCNKAHFPSSFCVKQYPMRRRVKGDSQPPSRKVIGDTYAICCGTYMYTYDVDCITGKVTADDTWIETVRTTV